MSTSHTSAGFSPKPGAKASVGIFLAAILIVMAYATLISEQIGLIPDPTVPRNEEIMAIMLSAAAVICWVTKSKSAEVLTTQVFRSGMSASVCVLGVAWLGTTFINPVSYTHLTLPTTLHECRSRWSPYH